MRNNAHSGFVAHAPFVARVIENAAMPAER